VIIKQEQLKRFRKSDGGILPVKACNATGGKAITTTTTASQGQTFMHSNEEPTKLHRIAQKSSADKDCQFTILYHLMNKELLLE
jgi:hypothetical protein